MYSTVKRVRDLKKALKEQMPVSQEALNMIDGFKDDDFIPLDQDELKLVLRCGVQSWELYTKDWENPDDSFNLILDALVKLQDCPAAITEEVS